VMHSINIENSDAENMDLMHLQRRCTRDLSPRRSSKRSGYCFPSHL
jgi:hypothetical protein